MVYQGLISENIFSEKVFTVMLVYQPHLILLKEFFQILEYLHAANSIDIFAGDFNSDLLKASTNKLLDCLKEHIQIVNEVTHISGSRLDCAYLKNALLDEF